MLAPGGTSATFLLHAALIRWRDGRAEEARAFRDRALACPATLTPYDRMLQERVERELAPR